MAPAAITTQPPAGHPRFARIDAMRAIAALSVVAYHVAYVSGSLSYGWASTFTLLFGLGVPVFFAISGFVLYRPMVAARHGAPGRPWPVYASSRALRILPAYWVALLLVALYPGLIGPFEADWWRYWGLLQTYDADTQFLALGVAWTLCIEVSFYALLPLYALAMQRFAGTGPGWVRAELFVLGVLGVASVATWGAWELRTLLSTFSWFAVGMAGAVLSVAGVERARLLRRPGLLWLAAAALGAVLCVIGPDDPLRLGNAITGALGEAGMRVVTMALSVPIVALVLAPAIWGDGGLVHRVLSGRVLAWLGAVSYGIYLYHLPVLIAVSKLGLGDLVPGQTVLSYVVVALPVTIALAALSYYLIERPALSLRAWPRPRRRMESTPASS